MPPAAPTPQPPPAAVAEAVVARVYPHYPDAAVPQRPALLAAIAEAVRREREGQ